jgi:HSP20 family protein
MTITKWAPFQELDSMERRLRRVFEDAGLAPKLLPAADVYETDDRYVVELEVPGFEEEELGIEVSDHTLTVTGSRHEDTEKTEKSFRLRERIDREFERIFRLPPEVDTESIEASFASGVLKVEAAKSAAAPGHKVPITS